MATTRQESLTELGFHLHLFAAELTDGFFAAHTTWRTKGQTQTRCVLFFRKPFQSGSYRRNAAYALAIRQDFPYLRLAVCLEHTLEAAFAHLRCYGYSGSELWLTIPRTTLHQYFTWQEEGCLWNANQFAHNLLDWKEQ